MTDIERQRKFRERRKEKGLCCQCGINPRKSKVNRCEECTKKTSDNNRKRKQEWLENGLCGKCGKNRLIEGYKWCEQCSRKNKDWYKNSNYREEHRKKDIIRRKDRKQKIIEEYGGKCNCCGEMEPIFLTIDHINEDGARHREEIAKKKIVRGKSRSCTGTDFYKWLERNNFPKDNFQLLCMNCNFGKHRNGGICPHQQKGNEQ